MHNRSHKVDCDRFQVLLREGVQRLQTADLLCAVARVPWRLPQEPALCIPPQHEAAFHQTLHRERRVQHRRPALREHHDLSYEAYLFR